MRFRQSILSRLWSSWVHNRLSFRGRKINILAMIAKMLRLLLPIYVAILKKCYLLEKSLQIGSKIFPIKSLIRWVSQRPGTFWPRARASIGRLRFRWGTSISIRFVVQRYNSFWKCDWLRNAVCGWSTWLNARPLKSGSYVVSSILGGEMKGGMVRNDGRRRYHAGWNITEQQSERKRECDRAKEQDVESILTGCVYRTQAVVCVSSSRWLYFRHRITCGTGWRAGFLVLRAINGALCQGLKEINSIWVIW